MADSQETPLFQIIIDSDKKTPEGMRVFADGRYEFLSDRRIKFTAEGKFFPIQKPLSWEFVSRFNAEQIQQIHQALVETGLSKLAGQSPENPPIDHEGFRFAWDIDFDNLKNSGAWYDGSTPPEISAFITEFNQIRTLPAQSSVWQVWIEDRYEERTIKGIVNGVPELRRLVSLLLKPDPSKRPTPAADEINWDDRLLIKVKWYVEESETETHHLFQNGTYVVEKEDGLTLRPTLSPGRIHQLEAAAMAIDWAQLPLIIEV